MFVIKFLFFCIILAFVGWLAWINPGTITVNYGLGSGEFPLSYVFGALTLLGLVFGYLLATIATLKWRTTAHRWKRKADEAASKVEALSRPPLK